MSTEEAERDYIRRHNLHVAVEGVVGEALADRPDDPLLYIALKILEKKTVNETMLSVLRDCLDRKATTDDDCRELFTKYSRTTSATTLASHSSNSNLTALPSSSDVSGGNSRRNTKRKVISARACSVCGRDDRQGEQRSSGFKCKECVGIPSNPIYLKAIEEASKLEKTRDDEGTFFVNDYGIITTIGQGAYGKVRLCVHHKSGQNYCIKFLSKAMISKKTASGNPQAKMEGIKKIRDEIEIMKRLQHANIIQIYGTMESDTEIMIVMEYLEGGHLPSNFPSTPVPLRRLKRYIVGIARGLSFLHEKGIIHRDIKPDNILLDKQDNVKLADFGVSAFAEGEDALLVKGFAGSPFYMPPETFTEDAVVEGPATDVWSFGVTTYSLATGYLPPFEGTNLQDLGKSVRETEIPFHHDSELLNSLLRHMLQKNASERATLDQILHHELLRDVRIVKGHPVETVELGLCWDEKTQTISLAPDQAGDTEGKDIMAKFMADSKDHFQITQGNAYEVTLYDLARDPRRQVRNTQPTDLPAEDLRKRVEDWSDEDVDD
ncbi:hypothetical protein DIPPA_70155 [Diplonema papillatum]|nr:hypothetical protein DIPPA_70155 [Diplonema papillatum]